MASYSDTMTSNNIKLLVANKKVMENVNSWNKLELPISEGADGVCFIDDADAYNEAATKMGLIVKKSVGRIFYIDSDNDEVPIDSEMEYKEALKLIGERTCKGKFTTMKIETESSQKKVEKEKIKKSKVSLKKEATRLVDLKSAPQKLSAKKIAFESKPSKNVAKEDGSIKTLKTEVSKAWLEKHLKQLKSEIMADLEVLVEPLRTEQRKMSEMIASLSAARIQEEKAHTMMHDDHNYSASRHTTGVLEDIMYRCHTLTNSDSSSLRPQVSENFNGGKDDNDPCLEYEANCTSNFDDDISVYSGVLSITDSESENVSMPDDFVNVPLPSCFDIICAHGPVKVKSSQVNKSDKQDQKVKISSSLESEMFQKNPADVKFQSKVDGVHSSSSPKKNNFSNQLYKKSDSRQGKKKSVESVNSEQGQNGTSQNTYEENLSSSQLVENNIEGRSWNVTVHRSSQDDSNRIYVHEYHEKDGEKFSSSALLGAPTHYRHVVKSKDQTTKESKEPRCAPIADHSQKEALHPQDTLNANVAHSPGQSEAILPLLAAEVQQDSQQPMIKKTLRPGPLSTHQHPLASKQAADQKPQHLTPSNLITQHQLVVMAAQRCATEAQHTQSLVLDQPQNTPNRQDENSNQNLRGPLGGVIPRQMQEAAQEVKLWNEVESVGTELCKWVEMCQQMMEQIAEKLIEDTSSSTESLQKLATHALKTHQELEKMYLKFCREVQTVSNKIHAQKLQKHLQQGAGQQQQQRLIDDPILILPEKLMQVISATLNTTFNILGNVSKLGVTNAPNICGEESVEKPNPQSAEEKRHVQTAFKKPILQVSAPVEELQPQAAAPVERAQLQAPAAIEKPQSQIPAAMSPLMSTMGNIRLGYTVQTPYCPPIYSYRFLPPPPIEPQTTSSSRILSETLGTQDPNFYRMHPMGPNIAVMWEQPNSVPLTQPSQQTLRVHPQVTPQPLQTQIRVDNTIQRQLQQRAMVHQQHLQATIPQQMQSASHQQAQIPQPMPVQPMLREDAAGRLTSEVSEVTELSYNGNPMGPLFSNMSRNRMRGRKHW